MAGFEHREEAERLHGIGQHASALRARRHSERPTSNSPPGHFLVKLRRSRPAGGRTGSNGQHYPAAGTALPTTDPTINECTVSSQRAARTFVFHTDQGHSASGLRPTAFSRSRIWSAGAIPNRFSDRIMARTVTWGIGAGPTCPWWAPEQWRADIPLGSNSLECRIQIVAFLNVIDRATARSFPETTPRPGATNRDGVTRRRFRSDRLPGKPTGGANQGNRAAGGMSRPVRRIISLAARPSGAVSKVT